MAREICLLLAGDAQITRPWSHIRDPSFLSLTAAIRAADVSIANLETVIHDFQGPAQANAGGVYMASQPAIAAELKWAGFDMLGHANNHAFDYGASGVLDTIRHVESQGLVIAGSGRDLQSARVPKYFRCEGGTVALVAMASDFVQYGKASYSRADLPGRPGINPLDVRRRQLKLTPSRSVSRLGNAVRQWFKLPRRPVSSANFELTFSWGWHANRSDVTANLESISSAATKADVVVTSIHAHRQKPWLTRFAHQAIDRGSQLVLVHGPHQIRGIELYQGRPIFYSLGDFVFESEYVARLPAEAYQRLGLAPDAPIEALRALNDRHMSGLLQDCEAFRSTVVSVSIVDGLPRRIRLLPIELNFDSKDGSRGRPKLASPTEGERIIRLVEKRSSRFGTSIRYYPAENIGEVVLG